MGILATAPNWTAVATIVGLIGFPLLGGLLAISMRLGSILQELKEHGRRLDVIETAAIGGDERGRRRKHQLEEE